MPLRRDAQTEVDNHAFPISRMRLGQEWLQTPAASFQTAVAQGSVTQYLMNPDGYVDGLLLADNNIIRFPPHLGQVLAPFRNATLKLAIEVEAADIEWSFDEQQLSRALHNLVANAVQRASPDGWVKVTAAVADGQLEISVEDSGSGVLDELKEKIFEPFVSSRSEGSGLGLAIAREIVEAHGGTLRCINGLKGARFAIRLPHSERLSFSSS
jgi:signal transduction histidine kinase